MSNSALVSYVKLSPNGNTRIHPTYNPSGKITKITVHHAAGVLTARSLADYMAKPANQKSANYCIGNDGAIALGLNENMRAWTSSSRENDYKAVTVEVSNSKTGGDWPVSDAAFPALVKLCADVCKRNGIPKLYYDGTKNGSLTLHEMFAATNCPGPYLKSKLGALCEQVNALLEPKPEETYYVQVGAYSVRAHADIQFARVKAKGFDAIIKYNGTLYRVQVGAYTVKANADNMAKRLQAAGFEAFLTIKGGTVVSANPEAALIPGDVNGNGKLDADDARMAQRAVAKLQTLTEEQKKAADMDGDGKLTAADPREILRKSAGLE